MLEILKKDRFRRLFSGTVLTNIGDSVYFIAAMWFVWELTGSTMYTGLAGFLVKAPSGVQFLFGPLVDRWPLRKLLVVTQLTQAVSVLLVPLAAVTGHLSVWVVLVLMPILTLLNQIVYPAQRAALPQIIESDNLVKANSLFTTSLRAVNMGANAASGVLIAVVGAVSLYLLDSLTFLLAAALFWGVVVPGSDEPDNPSDESNNPADESSTISEIGEEYIKKLRDGFEYMHGSSLMPIMAVALAVNFGYGLTMAVLPAYADLLGGAQIYGLILAVEAAGTATGAIGVSWLDDKSVGKVILSGYLFSSVAWILGVFIAGKILTLTFFYIAYVPVGAANVLLASLRQAAVHDDLLGRVGSVNSSVSTLILPVGTLVGGYLPNVVSVSTVVALNGLAFAFVTITFLFLDSLRSLPAVENATPRSLNLTK
jgi:MFS family permease